MYRDVASPFPDTQVELLKAFADQAVIAVENVRLFKELEVRNIDLTVALEQQTATSEILRVISQSQTDVQPVFETIVRSVRALCNATFSGVYLLDGDTLSLAAAKGMDSDDHAVFAAGYPRRSGRTPCWAPALRGARSFQHGHHDGISDFFLVSTRIARRRAHRPPVLPSCADHRAHQVDQRLALPRSRPFSEAQIALLQTFADQAVIAIENVRLFKELETRNRDLTEALEQQTATSEILRVISQSRTDVQPVFDTIARAAQELCDATSANVFTYDGELVHVAAVEYRPAYGEALRELFPRPPSRDTAVLRAILTRSVIAIPDVLADDKYVIGEHSAAGGFRSVLAVPLIRDGEADRRHRCGPRPARTVPGLAGRAAADLCRPGGDRHRERRACSRNCEARTTELTRSVGELKALGDVGQAVSSTLDLETVLSTIVSRATQLAGMDGGSIYEYDEGARSSTCTRRTGYPTIWSPHSARRRSARARARSGGWR